MQAESTRITSWPTPSWSTVVNCDLKKFTHQESCSCAEARNPALLMPGLLQRLPKRRIRSLREELTISSWTFSKALGWLESPYSVKMTSGNKLGKRSSIGSSVQFQMPWLHKAGQAVYGSDHSSSLYYSVLGVKKQTEKKKEKKQVTTNVSPVPPGPSHLEHLPVCESLLK